MEKLKNLQLKITELMEDKSSLEKGKCTTKTENSRTGKRE